MKRYKQLRNSPRRGVAMFVVLAAIFLVTVLGYVGLTLASRDNDVAGSVADMNAQQLAARAGVELTIGRLQASDEATLRIINQYHAKGDGSKWWVDFNANPIQIITDKPDFYELGSGQLAVRVRVMGISKIDGTTLGIALEATGKGKTGDEHSIVSVYKLFGLQNASIVNTKGPTSALYSQGGFDASGMNMGVDAIGGIYAGAGSMQLQGAGGVNSTSLRVNANVKVEKNITYDSNSVIGGNLDVQAGRATFNRNLLVRGDLMGANGGTLVVNGTLVVEGGTYKEKSPNIQANNGLIIRNRQFKLGNAVVQVGTTSNSAKAWFNQGLTMEEDAASMRVYGSIFVQNSTGISQYKNMSVTESLLVERQSGATSFPSVDFRNVRIDGKTEIQGDATTNSTVPATLTAGSDTLWQGGTSTYIHGKLGGANKHVSFHGRLMVPTVEAWGSTNDAVVTGDFYVQNSLGTSPRIRLRNSTKRYFSVTDANTVSSVKDATGVDIISPLPVTPAWTIARPSEPTNLEMGFNSIMLDLSNASSVNAPSVYNGGNFPAGFLTSRAAASLVMKNTKCKLNSTVFEDPAKRPNGNQLACIYNEERARKIDVESNNQVYNGPMYKDFLVLYITKGFNYAATSDPLEIPTGVKVMFVVNSSTDGVLTNWYSNALGSVQVLIVEKAAGTFSMKKNTDGSNKNFYGFIQFKSGISFSDVNMNLIGSLEGEGAATQLRLNAGSLVINKTSSQAIKVFSDIADAFSMGPKSGRIISFNGDGDTELSKITILEKQDGWVQFQRIGEFR